MQQHLPFVQSDDIISTLILIVTLLVLQSYLRRKIFKWKFANPQVRVKWLAQVRIIVVALMFFGLLFIWGPQLKEFALSVTALAAALVIATKELILCLMGGLLKASNHLFSIGDRISVSDYHGDVIDHTFMSTRLREIGPGQQLHQYTGREVVIPNSLFLTNAVFNESELGPFSLHIIQVPLDDLTQLDRYEATLIACATELTHPYKQEASNSLTRISFQEGVDTPSVEPRVSIRLLEHGRADLYLRVPVPTKRKGRVEQDILHAFVKKITAQ